MGDAFERQIEGRWHDITLQEVSECVDHDILIDRFRVTHYAGCAILFSKDTFFLNIDVKSIYLHVTRRGLPDQVMQEQNNASFRRPPLSGQKTFNVLAPHISNIYTKERYCHKVPCHHDWSTD